MSQRPMSSWRDDVQVAASDGDYRYSMDITLKEQQLLLRLRMLEAGSYILTVVKSQRGMVGLQEWRLVECLNAVDNC
jgi:hypothetical protein